MTRMTENLHAHVTLYSFIIEKQKICLLLLEGSSLPTEEHTSTLRPLFILCSVFGLSVTQQHRRSGASVWLLAALLVLLETEAGPAAQFPLLLGKVVGSRGAGPRL